MIYLICFTISLIFLVYILSFENVVDINLILLVIIVSIGNGGFYALSCSRNLEEAIIANSISYVIGIFAPVTVFRIVCSICRVHIRKLFLILEYAVQLVIYLSVLTIGKTGLYYKTVEYHAGPTVHLTKTYGPMHTAYFVSLILYTLASLILGLFFVQKKNVVSRSNVVIVTFVNLLVVGIYIIERLTQLPYELMPVAYVISLFVLMIPLIRIYSYSVYDNRNLFAGQIEKTAYIVFDKKGRYMSCSEYATTLFPELNSWELDSPIPGSGGRFNTFLRQPFMNFIHSDEKADSAGSSYEYRGEYYHYEIRPISGNRAKVKGYIIQVSVVTGAIEDSQKGLFNENKQ